MRERNDPLRRPDERCDVLRAVPGGGDESHGRSDQNPVCLPVSPCVAEIYGLVVVDPGVGKQSGVECVVRVVVRQNDVGDTIRLDSE